MAVPGLLVVDVVDMVWLLPLFVLFLLLLSSVSLLSWWLVVCVKDALAVTSGHMCVTCCVRIWKLCSAVHRVLNPVENKYSVSVVVNGACLATIGLWVRILVMYIFKCYVIFLLIIK